MNVLFSIEIVSYSGTTSTSKTMHVMVWENIYIKMIDQSFHTLATGNILEGKENFSYMSVPKSIKLVGKMMCFYTNLFNNYLFRNMCIK